MSTLSNFLNTWSKANSAYDLHKRLTATGLFAHAVQMNAASFKTATYKKQFDNSLLHTYNVNQNIFPKEFESNFNKVISLQGTILDNLFRANVYNSQYSKTLNQTNILWRATGSLTAFILSDALKPKNWNSFDAITPFYEKVAELTTDINDKQTATTETLQKFENLLIDLKSQLNEVVIQNQKTYVRAFYNLINVVGFLIGLYGLYLSTSDASNEETIEKITTELEHLEEKNNSNQNETQFHFEKLKNDLKKHFDSLFADNVLANSLIDCPIRTKPITNSGIISVLKKDEVFGILDSCKKYYLIILKRDTNEYPITGWVLKKHTIINKYARNIY